MTHDERVAAVHQAVESYLDQTGNGIDVDAADLAENVVYRLERLHPADSAPAAADDEARPRIEALADAVSHAASTLALRDDVAAVELPDRMLYALANTTGALASPLRALADRTRHAGGAPAAEDLSAALASLQQAEQAIRRAQRAY